MHRCVHGDISRSFGSHGWGWSGGGSWYQVGNHGVGGGQDDSICQLLPGLDSEATDLGDVVQIIVTRVICSHFHSAA